MPPESQIPNPKSEIESSVAFARRVLDAEAEAVRRIVVDEHFDRAVRLVVDAVAAGGSLVVSGLGKSGLIGQKLSATFSSTGTPSHFLHPVEALHGDLGRVRRGDAVLMLSYSGNTEELVTLAELLRQDGIPLVALTGAPGSAPGRKPGDSHPPALSAPASGLARNATVTLSVGDITEACPLELAPTSSTTAMLALGDALALAVCRARAFTADDFQKFHPGGGLGRQLTPVVEAMRFKVGQNLRPVGMDSRVDEAYSFATGAATQAGLRRPGALLVVDDAGKLAGILTDGDLRKAFIDRGASAWTGPLDAIMTRTPTTLPDTALVRDAVHVVREKRFDEIPIVDAEGRPVGLIDVQDLAALKVIEG